MNQELLFAKTLEEVKRLSKEQGNQIEKEQVEQAFAKLQLSEEQLALVFDYLKKHKIGVGRPVDLDEYLSEEETDYLAEYQKAIASSYQVSEGEKTAVTLSAMAGEKQAQNTLISLYLPQVVEIAKLYTGQGVFLEDLIGEGNMALTAGVAMLGCLEGPEEAEGLLVKMIMDAMEESIEEALAQMRKDQKILDKVNQVAGKARELSEDLHRKVTVSELSAETGMPEERIREAMRFSGFAIEELENE